MSYDNNKSLLNFFKTYHPSIIICVGFRIKNVDEIVSFKHVASDPDIERKIGMSSGNIAHFYNEKEGHVITFTWNENTIRVYDNGIDYSTDSDNGYFIYDNKNVYLYDILYGSWGTNL
jgi:hypothetical protein